MSTFAFEPGNFDGPRPLRGLWKLARVHGLARQQSQVKGGRSRSGTGVGPAGVQELNFVVVFFYTSPLLIVCLTRATGHLRRCSIPATHATRLLLLFSCLYVYAIVAFFFVHSFPIVAQLFLFGVAIFETQTLDCLFFQTKDPNTSFQE